MNDCDWECELLHHIQGYSFLSHTLTFCTVIGDPRNLLMAGGVWCAVAEGLRSVKGSRGARALLYPFVHMVIMADVLNFYLKFLLLGERPYWVRDSYAQMHLTCESGYGNPSGHVMASTAALYFLFLAHRMSIIGFIFINTLLALIAVSRVFVSAHYPHQVFFGYLIGVVFVWAFSPGPRPRLTGTRAWLAAFFIFNVAMAEIAVPYAKDNHGWDMLKSVEHARRACRIAGGLANTASPFGGLYRDLGFLAGLHLFSGFTVCERLHLPLYIRTIIGVVLIFYHDLIRSWISEALIFMPSDYCAFVQYAGLSAIVAAVVRERPGPTH